MMQPKIKELSISNASGRMQMVKLNHRTSRTNILFWIRLLTFIYGGGRGFSTVIKWCTIGRHLESYSISSQAVGEN